ncbi:MAG: hypothetical protein AAGK74_14705, partial [Chloroflexota bacterium]
MKFLLILLTLFGAVSIAAAQDTPGNVCPTLVVDALEMAALSCEDLASGTLCYGNSDLDAEPQPTTPLLQLNVPGDREN